MRDSSAAGRLLALPTLQPLTFELPPELEAPSPPEARGMTRDAVRMLVAHRGDGSLVHSHFSEIPRFLDEGDLVVLNTSGTLAAEVDGTGPDGLPLQVHLSTQLPAELWTVEVRRNGQAFLDAERHQH
jgi:S-adenosylmethionine:tRNA ribosyltransferase-isomerase